MRNSNALVSLLVVTLPLGACKDTARGPGGVEGEDFVMARRTPELEQNAGDATYLQKNAKFFFQVWDQTFTRKLDELPEAAEVPAEKRPYSGGYYAEQTGGTDVVMVGGKSPLAKYDEAFHEGRSQAVAWERENHTSGPAWAGHCNGYSATAQRHPKEPTRSVVRGGVTFDPKDIKALLAEVHMSADYEFLGGNRCEQSSNANQPTSREDPTKMGECEDINPGTLHAAVANWIGRMRHTLIMDMYRGDQVWNYPLYKYQVTNIQKNISEAQARQYVTGGSGDYIFNPDAQKFAYVQATLTYAEATKAETLGKLTPAQMNLSYVLELNGDGEIIGGEWVGRSVQEHPDFLWVALPPQTPNGTRFMGNPHVDAGEVIKLWAESVGYDPETPPLDIQRPEREDSWGKWQGFEVTLDGNRRGAVFAGKPAVLVIKRKGALASAGVELDLKLNGDPLKSFTPDEGDEVRHAFEPGLGLNRFEFVWKKDGTQVENQFLRFHVIR